MKKGAYFNIQFPFSFQGDSLSFVEQKIKEVLVKSDELIKQLPIISGEVGGNEPPTLSITLLCHSRPQVFKFFYDILCNWLLPYQTLGAPLLFTVDFSLPDVGLNLTYCEMLARFESVQARSEAKKNLSYLKGQIALGAGSPWFARKLLETNGISLDEKSVTINGYVHQIIKRFPALFDVTFYQEMNYALMGMPDPFKEALRTSPSHPDGHGQLPF